jgi:hypothetical protein
VAPNVRSTRLCPSAFVADTTSIEFHLVEISFQVSSAKEFRRSILTVSPPFTGYALHHPLTRPGVLEVPFGVIRLVFHYYIGWTDKTLLRGQPMRQCLINELLGDWGTSSPTSENRTYQDLSLHVR